MKLTYNQITSYYNGFLGLHSLEGHKNYFDSKTSLQIIRNERTLKTLVDEATSLCNELIEKSGVIDSNGQKSIRLDHPDLIYIGNMEQEVDLQLIEWEKIDTPENKISIECLTLLFDLFTNVPPF